MTAEIELLRQVADLGYPFVVLLFVFSGLRKMWGDLWPWWTEVYWPSRERKWQVQAEANERRDEAYQTVTAQFIGALKEYQNGFRTQATLEHERIIQQVQQIGTGISQALAEIVVQLRERLE